MAWQFPVNRKWEQVYASGLAPIKDIPRRPGVISSIHRSNSPATFIRFTFFWPPETTLCSAHSVHLHSTVPSFRLLLSVISHQGGPLALHSLAAVTMLSLRPSVAGDYPSARSKSSPLRSDRLEELLVRQHSSVCLSRLDPSHYFLSIIMFFFFFLSCSNKGEEMDDFSK